MKESDSVKKEIRVLGIDDAPFNNGKGSCTVIGTIFRGGNYIDGLISFKVRVDGNDATAKLVKAIKKTRHYDQLNCIMTDGIAVAGFNVIDINHLYKKTKLPVIVLMRRMPNLREIHSALKKMRQEGKMKIIEKAGKIYKIKIAGKNSYFQIAGISQVRAGEMIKVTTTHSLIPEPLRVAHIIASGIVRGESRGRA